MQYYQIQTRGRNTIITVTVLIETLSTVMISHTLPVRSMNTVVPATAVIAAAGAVVMEKTAAMFITLIRNPIFLNMWFASLSTWRWKKPSRLSQKKLF